MAEVKTFHWDQSTIEYMCEVQHINGWTSMLSSIITHVAMDCVPEQGETEHDLITDLFEQCEKQIKNTDLYSGIN